MISIRYKSGWLRFKTTEELVEVTGWSFDKITFALRTKTAILGIDLVYGQGQSETRKTIMKRPPDTTPKYQDLKNELRMVKKRKKRSDRVIRKYEETWFNGRIETNEIKHARAESARLQLEIERLEKAIEHHRRYESRRRNQADRAA